ncbi:MAG: hypothetical protein L6R30_09615 [Thermoanaerobaculia bacterium]|nr:hypothetical protein [Thermoanaerobaculia bacterium]
MNQTTNPFQGWTPTLEERLSALPLHVASTIIGSGLSSASDIPEAVAKLSDTDRGQLSDYASAVLNAGHLEREELTEALAAKGIKGKLRTGASNYSVALQFVQLATLPVAKEILGKLFQPTEVALEGSFCDFLSRAGMPEIDLTLLDPADLSSKLEDELESRLDRTVKVRTQPAVGKRGRLICQVFYERDPVDGTTITKEKKSNKKRLESKLFEQSAASTYFYLRRRGKSMVMTLRSPKFWIARHIREAAGVALWKDGAAIRPEPATSFNLDVFKDPAFEPRIVGLYVADIDSILVSEISIDSAAGNSISIAAPRRGSVMEDFSRIAAAATELIEKSVVEEVVLKFVSSSDKRRLLAYVKLKTNAIWMDDAMRPMIEEHLEAWGVYD